MADQFIQIPPDSTGKKLDTTETTVNGETVQRQRVQIAGGNDVDLATVTDGRLHVAPSASLAPAPQTSDLMISAELVDDEEETIATAATPPEIKTIVALSLHNTGAVPGGAKYQTEDGDPWFSPTLAPGESYVFPWPQGYVIPQEKAARLTGTTVGATLFFALIIRTQTQPS